MVQVTLVDFFLALSLLSRCSENVGFVIAYYDYFVIEYSDCSYPMFPHCIYRQVHNSSLTYLTKALSLIWSTPLCDVKCHLQLDFYIR